MRELIEAARDSVGVSYGLESAKMKLQWLLEELALIEKQLVELEAAMEKYLYQTGHAQRILSVKGIGIVTAASFLGEVDNPLRFNSARQIARYAGYNLIEDSSGKSKSDTCISKRGRKQLRNVFYQMAFTMVAKNEKLKALYQYLQMQQNNPLKKKQALVVITKKIITILMSLLKKRGTYKPELVLGAVRKEMMMAA